MRPRERGSMLLVVVFFLVVGGALAAGVLGATRAQFEEVALDARALRAYWAARSALEWGTFQVIDPDNGQGLAADQLPACFASPRVLTLPGDMAAFSVSVSCSRSPASGSHEEGQNRVVVYVLTATASAGAAGAADRVERRVQSTLVKCKSPLGGSAPDYACR